MTLLTVFVYFFTYSVSLFLSTSGIISGTLKRRHRALRVNHKTPYKYLIKH